MSKRVFAVCGTSTRMFALDEQLGLGGGGAGQPFIYAVESPYQDFDETSPGFARARSPSTLALHARGPRPDVTPAHQLPDTHDPAHSTPTQDEA